MSSKRERPSTIPTRPQLIAALRQVDAINKRDVFDLVIADRAARSKRGTVALTEQLRIALTILFHDEKSQCDHNPALILRSYNPRIKKIADRYTPHANDPDYLIHRTVHGHHIKTNVRGDGAQRSDTSARMHQRRMDENRGKRKRRPKIKIVSRGFQKPVDKQKIPSRPFKRKQ